jgi:hypothetical protein
MSPAKNLKAKDRDKLLEVLQSRFQDNMQRHAGFDWGKVHERLEASAEKLWSLYEMEQSGGEPDVVAYDKASGEFVFFDCSAESPKGRRSVCYDKEALDSRKQHKPKNSAMFMADTMGVQLLSEGEYRELQGLGEFDTKSSSWIFTTPEIRKRGGALFCDRRYDHVFTYHNGAESYSAARGFRCSLRV